MKCKGKEMIVLVIYQFIKISFLLLLNLIQDPGWSSGVVAVKRAINIATLPK